MLGEMRGKTRKQKHAHGKHGRCERRREQEIASRNVHMESGPKRYFESQGDAAKKEVCDILRNLEVAMETVMIHKEVALRQQG